VTRPPRDPMTCARDELARRAETPHPGWTFRHGLYGWTATRPCTPPLRSASLPGVLALISAGPAPRTPARAPAQ
jgi:hypothetical protein